MHATEKYEWLSPTSNSPVLFLKLAQNTPAQTAVWKSCILQQVTPELCAWVQLQPPPTLHLLALATCNLQGIFATSPSLLKNSRPLARTGQQWSKHRCILLHISTSTVNSKIIYNVSVGCFQVVEEAKRRTTYQVSRTCAIAAEIMSALTSGFLEWRHLVIERANLR